MSEQGLECRDERLKRIYREAMAHNTSPGLGPIAAVDVEELPDGSVMVWRTYLLGNKTGDVEAEVVK
jgi:hypothetical protein